MQSTYDIAETGKGIPAQFLGKQIPITIPDPHAADPVAEALASGRYESASALVSAANRSLRIMMRDDILEAATKEGATVESITTAASKTKFPTPRVVDPNAAPKVKGPNAGKIKAAVEKANKHDERLLGWLRAGEDKKVRQAVSLEVYSQEEVDAAREKLASEATTQAQA